MLPSVSNFSVIEDATHENGEYCFFKHAKLQNRQITDIIKEHDYLYQNEEKRKLK